VEGTSVGFEREVKREQRGIKYRTLAKERALAQQQGEEREEVSLRESPNRMTIRGKKTNLDRIMKLQESREQLLTIAKIEK